MKIAPFILLIILTVALAVATFAERQFGTPFVLHHFYGSWWMITLWAAVLLTGMLLCMRLLYKKRKPAFLLHCAFGLILAGALTTYLFAKSGQIHLRENGLAESTLELPFAISLNKFEMDYYTGTKTPADYLSDITIKDGDRTFDTVVSMNKIFKYRGFRFYQADYDRDGKGTVLSISYDPYGIAITYAGYLLLVLAMLWVLASKKGGFRKRIKSLSLIMLLLLPQFAFAQRTMTKDEARVFGRLSMSYNGRIVPIDTYARDFTRKITGKSSYKGFHAVQVLTGWMFFPEDWQEEPMIKIKDDKIRWFVSEEKKSKRLRFSDFFNAGIYKFSYADSPASRKGIREVEEKISLLTAQHSGSTLVALPQGNRWYACTDKLTDIHGEDSLFIAKAFLLIRETLREKTPESPQQQADASSLQVVDSTQQRNDAPASPTNLKVVPANETVNRGDLVNLFDKIAVYQQKRAEKGAISPTKTKVEIFYNKFDAASILFKFNIGVGMLTFGAFIWGFLTRRKIRFLNALAYVQIIHSMAFLSLSIGLRWYISSHIPMSNGYETMIFIAWCIMVITIIFGRKSDFIPSMGLLLSGFALLVASLGAMNPGITQLVPVLQSPWLSIHVSLIMISYALFAFMMFNGITALILHFSTVQSHDYIVKMQKISQIMLYPALFTLTAGIFVGAVWANVSWGRYWGWDPKEVWALITMLIYSLAMHSSSLKIFRNPLFFHVFSIVAFLSIIMTFFGVSWLFGGMHSY